MNELLINERDKVEVPTGLWLRMIAQHRPWVRIHSLSMPETWKIVKCPACDGDNTHIVRPGEPDYECVIWAEARILDLLPPGSEMVTETEG